MNSTQNPSGNGRRVAKEALEHVCSGSGVVRAADCYSPTFVDHVNGMEFRGLAGVERSVALYRSAFSDFRIVVQDQVVDGVRVASRYVVSGTFRGRRVSFDGITISRIENDLIVEDWSVTDTFGVLRQLGLWRALLMWVGQWRAARAYRAAHRRTWHHQ
jgi:predicted ester cyclase